MDKIKLAQRTIALLSSMIESGECHTSRSREMKDNALEGLEQLRIHDVSCQSKLLKKFWKYIDEECIAINCNNKERNEVIKDFFNIH